MWPRLSCEITGLCASLVQVLIMSPAVFWARSWTVGDALGLGAGEANFLGLCLLSPCSVPPLTFTTASSLALGISFDFRFLCTCMKSLKFQTPNPSGYQKNTLAK